MVPFSEDMTQNRFWKPEPWDDNLPSPGFITDFVLYTRGIETPTKFSTWVALWTVSSVLKRQAWFRNFPIGLFPNLYVFLIGPPRVVAKGYGISVAEQILTDFHCSIKDNRKAVEKRVNLLRSRVTPEAFRIALKPDTINPVQSSSGIGNVNRGSQICLITSELSTFLGQQQYNIGLIDRLTHYYDCKAEDDDLTISAKWQRFKDIYITWLAASTKQHLEDSIPRQAFGGGFMSRVIIVYQASPTRDYPFPLEVIGGPTIEDLKKRLAWVAINGYGEYNFTNAATKWYKDWYYDFKKKLKKDIELDEKCMKHRLDTHLKKVATLLRAQRYEEGREIGIRDLLEAEKILNATFASNINAVCDVGMSPETQWLNKITHLLKVNKSLRRDALCRRMSKHECYAPTISNIISQLVEEKKVVIKREGRFQGKPSKDGSELYIWGGKDVKTNERTVN